MPPRQPNQKAVAAKERKAANKAEKDLAKARKAEAAEAEEWRKGSNVRGAAKKAEAAAKADDAARKKREKAELLAAEEAESSGSGKIKKSAGAGMASKKGKKKKKNELELLEESLVGDAEKKAKAAKKKERERKEREARLQLEREKLARQKSETKDPLLANTEAMIGDINNDDSTDVKVGRAANVANASALSATGIEDALSALSTSAGDDQHPEKRMKALHKAYEERMMPEMKEQYPGLRQAQYKEKIFQLWKKSPENPMNMPR